MVVTILQTAGIDYPLEENRDINSIYVSGKKFYIKKNTKCIRSNIWIYFLLKQMFIVKQIVSQKF